MGGKGYGGSRLQLRSDPAALLYGRPPLPPGGGIELKLSEFDYPLPKGLIAQVPLAERDASRLLVVHRQGSILEHRSFGQIPQFIHPGDLLVLNDAKVRPCRLRGWKEGSGGRVEVLLLRERAGGTWEALLKPGSKVNRGQNLILAEGRLEAKALDERGGSRRLLQLNANGNLEDILRRWGEMPLPPYINRDPTGDDGKSRREEMDKERYQTVFARHEGAVAAPTAGLHFTKGLFEALRSQGVDIALLTLHVGPGTFQPVRSEEVTDHRMEPEEYLIPAATAEAIKACRKGGHRIIAVGTTCMRALESAVGDEGSIQAGPGIATLFIYPGYRFRVADVLLTNFHLPKSTLLMLVSAFAGVELCREAYREAIAERYRFYSYGDAMLIL